MTRIGIAVVEDAGRFLVGVREEGTALAGYSEFPGGKCTPDESPADCAIRECQEETGINARITEPLCVTTHSYPHGDVELHFFHCAVEEQTTPRFPFEWVSSLADCRFPDANRDVLRLLQARE